MVLLNLFGISAAGLELEGSAERASPSSSRGAVGVATQSAAGNRHAWFGNRPLQKQSQAVHVYCYCLLL